MNMKTLLLTTTAILMTTSAFAQDCKYQKVVTQKSGEIVSSTTDYDCETKPKVIYKEIEKPVYIYRDSTPVVTERVVYSEPTYHKPQPSIVSTIVGTLINHKINQTIYKNAPVGTVFGYGITNNVKIGNTSISYKVHEPGSCYANWTTGGTDCY